MNSFPLLSKLVASTFNLEVSLDDLLKSAGVTPRLWLLRVKFFRDRASSTEGDSLREQSNISIDIISHVECTLVLKMTRCRSIANKSKERDLQESCDEERRPAGVNVNGEDQRLMDLQEGRQNNIGHEVEL